jgi:hypothetical protein
MLLQRPHLMDFAEGNANDQQQQKLQDSQRDDSSLSVETCFGSSRLYDWWL